MTEFVRIATAITDHLQTEGKRRNFRREDGNVLVLAAFGLTFLLGCLGLAVDAGRIMYTQRQVQNLADAAAIAAANELSTCGSTSNCTAMQNAAKSALQENGVATGSITLVTQCGSSSATGVILTLNNGPCFMGTTDPNHGNTGYTEAVVKSKVGTIFAGMLHSGGFTVTARAEAGGSQGASNCIYVLNPSTGQAVTFNSNATLTSSNCGMIVDSTSSSAVMINSGSHVTLSSLSIVGGDTNNGGTISVTPQTGAKSVSDPLASLAAPTVGSCGTSTSSPYSG
ncbi:MAG: pilus assembly protein TadG-related protein, partial [Minisyncoccia bacterium]